MSKATEHENKEGVRRVFGFPDFWPTVEKEYPRFFEVGPKALVAMHSVADRAYPNPEPHQRGILNLGMLAGISFLEVVTLTVNGLGHGAMRIVRSLLETSINIEFFRLRPAEFEDYTEWAHVERFKEQEFLREHVEPVFKQLGAEVIAEIEQQMARIRPRFERVAHDGSRRLRGSWCSLDLGARAVVTGHQEVYRTINPLASSFVHETMYGMIKHFDAAKDAHRVEVPPTLDWSLQALSGAHLCMIKVVKTLSETFAVPCDPTFETLEKEWHYAWTEPR
jgi:hypothetical protein